LENDCAYGTQSLKAARLDPKEETVPPAAVNKNVQSQLSLGETLR